MSECNVAASLARVLSAAQDVSSAKEAFSRYEHSGIKNLLIKRAEAEFNMANAHYCIVQLAHKKKSAKLHLVSSSVDLDKANDQHEIAEEAVSDLRDKVTRLDCDPSTDREELAAAAAELEMAIQDEAAAKESVVRAQEAREEAELLLKEAEMQYAVIHARSSAVIAKAEELNDHIVSMIKGKIVSSSNPSVSRELKYILNSVHGNANTASELEHALPHTNEEAEDELEFLEASMHKASSLQYLVMSETEVLHRMKSLEQRAKLHEPAMGERPIDDAVQRNALELARSKLAHATACSEAAKTYSEFLDALSGVYNAMCNEKSIHENTSSSAEERSAASAELEAAKKRTDIYKILLEIAETKEDVASATLECCITSEIVRKVEEQSKELGSYKIPTGSKVHISDILKKYKDEHHNAQVRKELATLKHELAQTFFTIRGIEQQHNTSRSELSKLQKEPNAAQARWDTLLKVTDARDNLNSLREKSRILQEKIREISAKVHARDGILDTIESVGITRSTRNAYSSFPFRSFQEFNVFTSDKIFVSTREDTELFAGREEAADIQHGEETLEKTSEYILQRNSAEDKFTSESAPVGERGLVQHVDFARLGNNLKLITARKNLEYWDNEVLCRNADVHDAYLTYSNSKISIDRGSSLPVRHQHIADESHLGILQNFTIWETAKNNLAVAMAERSVAYKDVEIAALSEELAAARAEYKVVQRDVSSSAAEKKNAQDLVVTSEKRLQLAEIGKKVAVAELSETVANINLKKAKLEHKYVFGKKSRTPEEERYANLSLSSAEKELKLIRETRIAASRQFALLGADFRKHNALRSLHAAQEYHEYVTQHPSLHTDKERDEATQVVLETTRLVDIANKDVDTARARLRGAHIFDDKLESSERDLRHTQSEKSLIECRKSIRILTAELERVKSENQFDEQSIPPSIEEKIHYIEKRLDALLRQETYILSEINLLQTLAALDDVRAFNKYVQESSSYTAEEKSSAEALLNRKELEVELAKTRKRMAEAKLELAHMQLNTGDVRAHPVEGESSEGRELHTAAVDEAIAKYDADIALLELEILNTENKILHAVVSKHEAERLRKCVYESESSTMRERMLADENLERANDHTECCITEKNVVEATLAVLKATKDVAVAEDNRRRTYEDVSCAISEKKAANTILDNAIKALREATLAEKIAKSEQYLLLFGMSSDEASKFALQPSNGNVSATGYATLVDIGFSQRFTDEYLKLQLLCLQEAAARGKSGVYYIDDARKELVESAHKKIASSDKELVDAEKALETLNIKMSTEQSFSSVSEHGMMQQESSGIQGFETQLAVARRDLVKAERVQAGSHLQVVKAFENLSKVCDHHGITGENVYFLEHNNISVHEDGKKALNDFKIAWIGKKITDAKLDVANARIAVIEASKYLETVKTHAVGEEIFLAQESETLANRIKDAETALRVAEAREHVAKAKESAAIAQFETINNILLDNEDSLSESANTMRLSEAAVDIATARLNTIIAYEAHGKLEHRYAGYEASISTLNKICSENLESVRRKEEKLEAAVYEERLAEEALKDIISSRKEKTSASPDIESETLDSRQNKDSMGALLGTTSSVKPEENLQHIAEQIPMLFAPVSRIGESINKITDADIAMAGRDIASRRSLVLMAIKHKEELEQQQQLIYKNEAATTEEKISIDKSLEDANEALELAKESRNIAEIKLEIMKTARTLKIVKDRTRISAHRYEFDTESDEQYTDSDVDALKIAILRANEISSRLEVAKIDKELRDLVHAKEGKVDPGSTKFGITELCKKAAEADLALFATTKAYKKISDDLIRAMQKADHAEAEHLRESLEQAEKALETAELQKASVDSTIALLSAGKATPSAKGGVKLENTDKTAAKEKLKDTDLEKQLEFAKLQKEAANANLALFYATKVHQAAMDATKHVQESADEKVSELIEELHQRKRELAIAEARKLAIDSAITLSNEYKALERAQYNVELAGAGIRLNFDKAQAQQELDSCIENVKFAEASRDAFYAKYKVLKSSAELAISRSNYELIAQDLDRVHEDANRSFSKLRNAKYEFEINKQKTQVAEAEFAVLKATINLNKSSDSPASEEEGREAPAVQYTDETLQFLQLKKAIAKARLMVLEATYHLAAMEDKYIAEHKSSSTFENKSSTYALLVKATKDLQIARAAQNSVVAEFQVFNANRKLAEVTSSAASTDLEIQAAQHALESARTDKDVADARLNTLYSIKKSEEDANSQQMSTDHVDPENTATADDSPRAQYVLRDYGESIVDAIDRFSDGTFYNRAPREIAHDIITDFFEDNEEHEYVKIHKEIARAKEAVSAAARELKNAQNMETEAQGNALSASCEHKLQLAKLQKKLADAEFQLFSATVALKRTMAHDKFINTGDPSTSEAKRISAEVLSDARKNQLAASYTKALAEAKLEVFNAGTCLTDAENYYEHIRDTYENSHISNINVIAAFSDVNDAGYRLRLAGAREAAIKAGFRLFAATNEFDAISKQHRYIVGSNEPDNEKLLKNARRKLQSATKAKAAADELLFGIIRESWTQDKCYAMTVGELEHVDESDEFLSCSYESDSFHTCASESSAIVEEDERETLTSRCFDVKIEQVVPSSARESGSETPSRS
ncbi:hypothetical protein R4I06_03130 [Anaplasma bovis]